MLGSTKKPDMHGFENDQFLFYTAGKIGTRTLMHTAGMSDLTKTGIIIGSIRRKPLEIIIARKEITNKKIIVLVREPVSRIHSGLFELICKIMGGPYIRNVISQNGDLSFLNDPTFWELSIEQGIRFAPTDWSPNVEFDSQRWQYHIGNWLSDAETVSEIFTDSAILNIKDLSNFLKTNGIPVAHLNKYSAIFPKDYDTKKVFDAFIQGLELLPDRVSQINNYLAPEKECYERLINSPQYYKVG
jgi:hypothetical protein